MNRSLTASSNVLHHQLYLLVGTSIMGRIMSDKSRLKLAYIDNLRVPMVLGEKIRTVVDNTLTKIRRVRGCCGNYGQPGC